MSGPIRADGFLPSAAAASRSARTSATIARRSSAAMCRRRRARSSSAVAASRWLVVLVAPSVPDTWRPLWVVEDSRGGEEPGDGGGGVDPLRGPFPQCALTVGGDLEDLARRSAGAGLDPLSDEALSAQSAHQRVDGAVSDAGQALRLQQVHQVVGMGGPAGQQREQA